WICVPTTYGRAASHRVGERIHVLPGPNDGASTLVQRIEGLWCRCRIVGSVGRLRRNESFASSRGTRGGCSGRGEFSGQYIGSQSLNRTKEQFHERRHSGRRP